MSSQVSFGAFLNGAVSGFETGMDLRNKHDVYKQRRKDREDRNASQDAIAKAAADKKLFAQAAATGAERVVKPVTTAPSKPVAFAADIGAGAPQLEGGGMGGLPPAARVGAGIPNRHLQRFPDYRR